MFCLFYKRMKLFAASREVSAGASPPGAAPPESIADVPTGSGASPAELYRQKINRARRKAALKANRVSPHTPE